MKTRYCRRQLLPSPRVSSRCGVRAARLALWHVHSSSDWGTPNAHYRELPGERQPGPQESSAHSTKRSLTITTCKLVLPSAKRSCAMVGSSNCDSALLHTW